MKGRIKLALTILFLLSITSTLAAGRPQQAASAASFMPSEAANGLPGESSAAAGHLEYLLQDGYIHNWLVAGPQDAGEPDAVEPNPGIGQVPVEDEACAAGAPGWHWCYYRSLDDHWIDLTASARDVTGDALHAWAYAQVLAPSASPGGVGTPVILVLTSYGPADLWLNGRRVYSMPVVSASAQNGPRSAAVQAELRPGRNEVWVRMELASAPQREYAVALQLLSPTKETLPPLKVVLPTYIENVARRQAVEQLLDQAYLAPDVVDWGQRLVLHWADGLEAPDRYAIRIQSQGTHIHLQGEGQAQPSAIRQTSLVGFQEGAYQFVLMPPVEEYHVRGIRYQRSLPIYVIENAYTERPYGTYESRRWEALDHAARRTEGLYAEMARLELLRRSAAERARWSGVSADLLLEAVAEAGRAQAGSDAGMVGLLGMLHRYPDEPNFPPALQAELGQAILHSPYWLQRTTTAHPLHPEEGEDILFYTAQILAGQLYPELQFTQTGRSGAWHRQQGERQALAWLSQRATAGLGVYIADDSVEPTIVALSHLADLAEDSRIRGQAAAALNNVIWTIALHSYEGVVPPILGRPDAAALKSGRLLATASISRLLWGTGVWNQHVQGTVSLACAAYQPPADMAETAVLPSGAIWSRQAYPGETSGLGALLAPRSGPNIATYKTPDYALSSAQDDRAGQRGDGEHVWQATLGPDALAFVSHPANMSESDAHAVGFWRGNATLPRVAQWKETLIAVHNLPDGDWLGFTHAYWPAHALDESVIRDGWAFARRGDGYIALTAAQGIELITEGPGAYRELRSYGQHNVWLCLMGRWATDGDFESFQRAVLSLDVRFDELGVRLETLRGQTLSFGWKGPLQIQEQLTR